LPVPEHVADQVDSEKVGQGLPGDVRTDDSAWLWRKARPEPLFVAAKQLTPSAGHPFNQKLNQLLDEDRVDAPLQEGSIC
jgi:hypothetical protein